MNIIQLTKAIVVYTLLLSSSLQLAVAAASNNQTYTLTNDKPIVLMVAQGSDPLVKWASETLAKDLRSRLAVEVELKTWSVDDIKLSQNSAQQSIFIGQAEQLNTDLPIN